MGLKDNINKRVSDDCLPHCVMIYSGQVFTLQVKDIDGTVMAHDNHHNIINLSHVLKQN